MIRILCGLAVAVAGLTLSEARAQDDTVERAEPVHAISQFDDPPLYPADFEHWNFVNPDAPRGGHIVVGAFGSFDSVNNFIMQGDEVLGLDLIYTSLTGISSAVSGNSFDEASTVYGVIAETIELAEDRSWIIFNLRRDAHFHDGRPITAADVVWTHETLREEGRPFYRTRFYNDIGSIEALDDHTVRFTFTNTENRQLALAVGSFPVLPRHYWEGRTFSEMTLEPPLGNGPYRIETVDPGRSITYVRAEDFWADDLPHYRGMYNFERITLQYYRDNTVRYEAFKGGEFDFLSVTDPRQWTTGFEGLDSVEDGRMIMEIIPSTEPEMFSGFTFNLRRPMFQDPRVREALVQFYDFETARRQIHHGFFQRAVSLFPNTELVPTGLPEDGELALLESLRDQMPDHIRERIFTEEFVLPTTDGSGNIRANLRTAMGLLREAGWVVQDGALVNGETGEPMQFELIYGSPTIEPTVLALVRNFERGGILAVPRFVDGAAWQNRIYDYNYDLFFGYKRPFYPPGAELREGYGSAVADIPGNYNISGIQDPVLDALAEHVITAQSWDDLIQAARAFARYEQWSHLSIPFYFDDSTRLAYWDMFGRPETRPRFTLGVLDTWWYDPSNTEALRENR